MYVHEFTKDVRRDRGVHRNNRTLCLVTIIQLLVIIIVEIITKI